jgi:hypothetical protein
MNVSPAPSSLNSLIQQSVKTATQPVPKTATAQPAAAVPATTGSGANGDKDSTRVGGSVNVKA